MKRDGTLEVGDLVICDMRVCRVGLVNKSRARVDPITPALRGRNDFSSWDIGPSSYVELANDYEFDEADSDRLIRLLEKAELDEIIDEERRLILENKQYEREEAERIAAFINTPAHSAQFESEGDIMASVADSPIAPSVTSLKEKNKARLEALRAKKEQNAASKKQAAAAPNGKPVRQPKEPKVLKACTCGCGGTTTGYFVPGHDARFKGWLLKIEKGDAKREELLTPATIAKYKWVGTGVEGKAGKGSRPTTNYKGEAHAGYMRAEDV